MNGGLHIILNPTAGSGAAKRLQPKIVEAAAALWRAEASARGQQFVLHVTTRQGEATEFARQAVRAGASMIVAVGGDGTVQEIANGMLGAGDGQVTCELGIVNCGTGRGLADSLGLPESLDDQLRLIRNGNVVALDVGRVRYLDADNRADTPADTPANPGDRP